jgi:signal transduction histidine kinase
LLAALALLPLGAACAVAPRAGSDGVVSLAHAQLLADDRETPPDSWHGAERVELPDFWPRTRPDRTGAVWYRLELPPRAALGEQPAVLLPVVHVSASVFANGAWIARLGPPQSDRFMGLGHPLLAAIPPSLLRGDGDALEIRVFGRAFEWNQLAPVLVGPYAALEPRRGALLLRNVRLPELTSLLGLGMLLFIGMIWLARREAAYGLYLVATAFWVVFNLHMHLEQPPLPAAAWNWLSHAAIWAHGVAATCLIHRVFAIARPRLERLLWGYAALGAAATALAPAHLFIPTATAFNLGILAVALYGCSAMILHMRALAPRERTIWIASGVALVLAGANDFAINVGARGEDSLRLLSFASPLLLSSFAVTLLSRFLRAYARAENLNVELEQRVQEKHAELERNFARLRDLERERAVGDERERIMREMHDGLGGQLVSTIAMVQGDHAPREQVVAALREALEEMRLVIHSIDPHAADLPTLLGLLRDRLEPRVERAGLRFEWRVGDLPELPPLGAQTALHVLRIVQEAISNALRHARATQVQVATGASVDERGRAGVFVEVRDDGLGLRGETARGLGHGLANMQWRARQLGGAISVGADGAGTVARLWLPAEAAGPSLRAAGPG